jgi:hypothetical protein
MQVARHLGIVIGTPASKIARHWYTTRIMYDHGFEKDDFRANDSQGSFFRRS